MSRESNCTAVDGAIVPMRLAYLESVNQGRTYEVEITCIVFAPNAPEQKPIENIWLKENGWWRVLPSLPKL